MPYVLTLEEVDRSHVAAVGGKGAHLGELSRLEGVDVPPGFCVTTDAFLRMKQDVPSIDARLDQLARLEPSDREAVAELAAEVRQRIAQTTLPDEVADAITTTLDRLGPQVSWAVRSSATAEDSPRASFAGQHASFLGVVGAPAVLEHVRRCWASLYTERAVIYRMRQGLGHQGVHMAVVVQRMVTPRASGVLFTADPVTCNRKVAAVEVGLGHGESVVAGWRNAASFTVRGDGEIEVRRAAAPGEDAALTGAELVRLAKLGRRIEAHLGAPQDIEWCLADDGFQIVQSRPITTLFPIPTGAGEGNRVYLSVGHQQMMTEPLRPLGLSLFQLTALRPMFEAGGRLFVDVTQALSAPHARGPLLEMMARSEPLTWDALQTLLDRGDFIPSVPAHAGVAASSIHAPPPPLDPDPALVPALIRRSQEEIARVARELEARSGVALIDFILEDLQALKRALAEPQSVQVVMGAMQATWWLDDHLLAWLGEKNAADALALSAPHNVTSEMGLALLDVADVARPWPAVVALLERTEADDEGFLDALAALPGGREVRGALEAWLDRYGMRCPGEIDVTRPRWSERPAALAPLLLANVRTFAAGEAERRFEQGRQEASRRQRDLLERLRALPDGEQKAEACERMMERVRAFMGYREYPKYGMIHRYFLYKQALLGEARLLRGEGVLHDEEDIFYLTLHEVRDLLGSRQVDHRLIADRKDAFRAFEALAPPRVVTSDGEVLVGRYRRAGVPAGALPGLPVSAGVVEGRARVILDMAEASLKPGDILVTPFTDPGWTPLFLAARALVTEVGGLMTHGAVIAREYGLPAVVGVEEATRRIKDGDRIRVDGGEGLVEILG